MSKYKRAGCGNTAARGNLGTPLRVLITDPLQHEGKPDWGSFSLMLQHPSSAAPSSPCAWLQKHPQNEILSTMAAEGKSSNERRKRLPEPAARQGPGYYKNVLSKLFPSHRKQGFQSNPFCLKAICFL